MVAAVSATAMVGYLTGIAGGVVNRLVLVERIAGSHTADPDLDGLGR